jgi:hypothetical protein
MTDLLWIIITLIAVLGSLTFLWRFSQNDEKAVLAKLEGLKEDYREGLVNEEKCSKQKKEYEEELEKSRKGYSRRK